ncbi:prenyltransferase/squalene oxidase repeat-containing protein [Pontiella sulfatireligans]|uniref:Sporulenol synthase n=1 Tax=Pontiella sulfatireligans TaxID=2750658 RepID=A0A6C2UNW7_9BACT|nr:prenyltransferase/squalene oxidase repeat-containing protein [Pontiella sulfatireligans]VGO21759.1 Sporulenol synthase [Pontiella sulfatireligans]
METQHALNKARERLLAGLLPDGRWEGELSSSALATAVASFALKLAGKAELAERGCQWLESHRNEDGGWGDSPESPSNFTATLLCRCALDMETGDPQKLADEILHFYGEDRTFSVPILTMCMLSGKLGGDWSAIPQLPFELAVFPHKFYRFLNLPVVSYALPALIAIGLVRHQNKPSRWAFYRNGLVNRVLEILRRIQPESGGFLEAAPLSGFVAMSLIGGGFGDHPVTQACLRFLENTVRDDGSWPIDVNLSTWVTSLSVRALEGDLSDEQQNAIRDHLLKTQWTVEHPFTHAEPGGWGWTNEQGGVPDADDTAAALIALRQLGCETKVAENGLMWLMELQNRDGGMPTFCQGWGKLPFDRSCPDLTAHAIRACMAWRGKMDFNFWAAMEDSIQRGLQYLEKQQRPDGSWLPLWFGNQSNPKNENPVYGTVRVLEALVELDESEFPRAGNLKRRGFQWLESAQNPDGSWGSSVEETALAVGLTGKGVDKLLEMTGDGTRFLASPIGLYFASLWYSEKLYPLIFTVKALKRCATRQELGDE